MTDATPSVEPTPPVSPSPVRKKSRRWLKIIGILLVGLVLLVGFLPTLISLSPVRSLIASQISGQLDGRVEIGSLSLGWISPVRIEGLRVYDKQNAMVLDIGKIETEATLLSLVRQNFDLGKTTIVADATKVVVRADGKTNLHDIFRISSAPTDPQPAGKIPDVKIDLTLDLRGGIQLVDERGVPISSVQVRPGTGGTVRINDINAGIDSNLKLIYQVDTNALSTVTVAGTIDPFDANQVNLANLAAKMQVILTQVDIAAAKTGVALAGVKGVDIAGQADGVINLGLVAGQAGTGEGEIEISSLLFASDKLPDRYQPKGKVRLPIKIARTVEGGVSRLSFNFGTIAPEFNVALSGDIAETSIVALSAKKMPEANGTVSLSINADPQAIATALPNTLKLLPDVQIDRGQLFAKVDLWLKPESLVYGLATNFDLSGRQGGKPISIQPIELATAGTVVDLNDPLLSLQQVSADLKSQFATFTAKGTGIAELSGSGKANLDLLRQQLAQFADLGALQLAGQAEFTVRNLQTLGLLDRYSAQAEATLTGIRLTLPKQPALDLPFAKIAVTALYAWGKDAGNPIEKLDSAHATLVVGKSPTDQLIDAKIGLTDVDLSSKTIKSFDLEKAVITSLPEVQRMAGGFIPQLKANQIELVNGAVYLVARGSADINAKSAVLEQLELSVPSLQIKMKGSEILNERKVALALAGKVQAGETISLDLARFNMESSLATLTSQEAPIKVVMANGMPTGTGKLNALVNFVPLNRIAQAFSTTPLHTVTSGQLVGDLVFANDGNKPTVGFDGKVENLTIDQTPIKNESLTLAVNAATDLQAGDKQTASIDANVKGAFVSLQVKDTSVRLSPATPAMQRIERAVITLGVPDSQKAVVVARALLPILSIPYTPSGGIALVANVTDKTAKIDFKASRLTLTDDATGRVFRFDPRKPVTLLATIEATGNDQIESLQVSALESDLDVAKITMAEKVVIDHLQTQPSPRGKLAVSGNFDRVTPLLQFLQNTPKAMPYRGLFDVQTTLDTKNQAITANLNGHVRDFAIMNDASKVVFTEKEISLDGDLTADLKQKLATIHKLDVVMKTSQAATINVSGMLRQYDSPAPAFEKFVVNVNAIGEKSWPIIFPLLPPDQQEKLAKAALSGPVQLSLQADGAYLLGKPLHEAVMPLIARGDLKVASADLNDAYGLQIQNLQQLFWLEKGMLVTGHRKSDGKYTFAPPFDVNGGKGDLGSTVINISHPDMLVSIGRKQKLLTNVKLNPVMAAQLGSLASVMFKDSKKASGIVDVIVMDCTNVPLNDLLAGSKRAKAEIMYSVKDLRLDGSVPSALSSLLQWGDQGIVGKIDNGSLVLSDGIAYQNMTLDIMKVSNQRDAKTGDPVRVETYEQLMFKGGIGLENQKFVDYSLWMSKGLLLADWRKSFPNGATVPLTGSVSDVNSILTQTIGGLAIQGVGGSLLDDLLKKNKKKD